MINMTRTLDHVDWQLMDHEAQEAEQGRCAEVPESLLWEELATGVSE
jgi:hypothetical protein